MNQKIPILMYHSIQLPRDNEVMRSLHVKPASFARQMWLLSKMGYVGLSMRELQPYLDGKKQGKVVGITFDDGYLNNLTAAAPILKRHGFSGTCYVVSSAIGGDNFWDHHLGIPSNEIMNANQILEWESLGLEIGCHTKTHPDLTKLTYEVQTEELQHSKTALEEITGKSAVSFCYPYGKYNEQLSKLAKNIGFETSTTMNRGRANQNHDPHELPRIPVTFHTLPRLFLLKILTSYEDKKH